MPKLHFQHIKKGNNHAYLLRIIEADVVERENNSPDDSEAQTKEQEDNNQIIRFEEDLFNAGKKDDLPF